MEMSAGPLQIWSEASVHECVKGINCKYAQSSKVNKIATTSTYATSPEMAAFSNQS